MSNNLPTTRGSVVEALFDGTRRRLLMLAIYTEANGGDPGEAWWVSDDGDWAEEDEIKDDFEVIFDAGQVQA